MELSTIIDGTKAIIAVGGKLTVATAPDLEGAVNGLADGINDIDFDIARLEYISSAGLRVLVGTQKLTTRRGGTMRILHPSDDVMEIFEMTGLSDIMVIER